MVLDGYDMTRESSFNAVCRSVQQGLIALTLCNSRVSLGQLRNMLQFGSLNELELNQSLEYYMSGITADVAAIMTQLTQLSLINQKVELRQFSSVINASNVTRLRLQNI